MIRLPTVGLTLGHRRRRWPSVKPTVGKRIMSAVKSHRVYYASLISDKLTTRSIKKLTLLMINPCGPGDHVKGIGSYTSLHLLINPCGPGDHVKGIDSYTPLHLPVLVV